MWRLFSLICLGTLVGCASSAPAPVPPPVAPAVRAPPPPPPVAPRVEPELPEPAPVVPPSTPRLRVSQRSVFEQDRIVRWTLENGLTVYYAWDEDAPRYTMLVGERGEPGGSCLIHDLFGTSPQSAVLQTDGVSDAIGVARQTIETAGLPIAASTVTLHGAIAPEWVEAEVATTLGAVRSGGTPDARRSAVAAIEVEWADLGALVTVAAVLADRLVDSDTVHLIYDAEVGRLRLSVEARSAPIRELLGRQDDAAIRDARTRAARVAASGRGVAVALHQLGRLPGRFQPARPPSDVRRLVTQIERTPPERVNALLAQLANALSE